jgi:hypothetical protein
MQRYEGKRDLNCPYFNLQDSLPGPFRAVETAGDLLDRKSQGDWYLESHIIEIPVLKNSYKLPCLGDYSFYSITLIDTAGRIKQIGFNEGTPEDLFYTALNITPAPYEVDRSIESILPEYSCPRKFLDNSGYAPLACLDSVVKDYKITIDKTILDKAAADKAAADAKKKTTITCVKGKLTKKVTAIKPKCPSGYKKK